MQYTEVARDDHFIYILEPITETSSKVGSLPILRSLTNHRFSAVCDTIWCTTCIFRSYACSDTDCVLAAFPHIATDYPELLL